MAEKHRKTDKNALFVSINGNFLSKQACMRELGIVDQRTFDRYYSEEYDNSKHFWASKTIASLFRNLVKGKETTTLKCAKEFLGFNPVDRLQHEDPDGKAIQPVYNVTILGQDNEALEAAARFRAEASDD